MKNSIFKYLVISSILIAGSFSVVVAQSNLTLYNMKTIPQRIKTNPAHMSDAKNFLGLPAISSQYVSFSNNAISINALLDLLEPNAQDSFTFNAGNLGSLFEKTNFISFEQSFDVLSFGFRIKKKSYMYFTSSISQNFRFAYPGDLFALVSEGNGGKNLDREFDLAFGIDFLQYADVGIGFNRKFMNDKLTLGARYRYIKGINIVNTERNDITFRTDPNTYDLTIASDIKINAASSLFPIDGLDVFSQGGDSSSIGFSDVLNKDNIGWAVDFGIDYKLSDKITLSAAANNIGRINWNTNTFNIASEDPGASYTYSGIHFDDVFNEDGSNLDESFRKIGDTIVEKFRLRETATTFTTGLFAEFYVGGNYNLSRNHNAGILLYGNLYQDKLNPAVSVSWNSKLTNILAISGTYSVMRNSYFNLGFGLSLNGGPFQVYVVSDNLGSLVKPNDVNNLNVRAGFNLAMQRKDVDELAQKKADKEDKKNQKAAQKVEEEEAKAEAKRMEKEAKKAKKKADKEMKK